VQQIHIQDFISQSRDASPSLLNLNCFVNDESAESDESAVVQFSTVFNDLGIHRTDSLSWLIMLHFCHVQQLRSIKQSLTPDAMLQLAALA